MQTAVVFCMILWCVGVFLYWFLTTGLKNSEMTLLVEVGVSFVVRADQQLAAGVQVITNESACDGETFTWMFFSEFTDLWLRERRGVVASLVSYHLSCQGLKLATATVRCFSSIRV